jgi:hypothetical protein
VCGGRNITVGYDAFAKYRLLGFDNEGYIIRSAVADVATYDDEVYVCDDCDFKESDSEVFLYAGIAVSRLDG